MAKPKAPKNNSKVQLGYNDISRIVWAFADTLRDNGNGTTEDNAKVVIPTCLVNAPTTKRLAL